jgi:hypothetical protein
MHVVVVASSLLLRLSYRIAGTRCWQWEVLLTCKRFSYLHAVVSQTVMRFTRTTPPYTLEIVQQLHISLADDSTYVS